jgi:hypothetical protein
LIHIFYNFHYIMRITQTIFGTSLASLLLLTAQADAQVYGTQTIMNSAEYESIAVGLRQAAPQQYEFSQALLADVLRFLATDAGIPFISLPQDSPEGSKLTTFTIKASPFAVLETVCKSNNLSLVYENNIWYFRSADDSELIGKSYSIKNNAWERVERVNSGGGLGSPSSAGGGGSGGGGGSSGGGSGLNLQGSQETFSVKQSEIIKDIRDLLGLPPEDSGEDQSALQQVMPGQAAGGAADMARAMNSNQLSSFRKPKVIWKSDSNTL